MNYPADWLIRSKHNRNLPNGNKLWRDVTEGEPLGEIRFIMPSRQGQKAREVRQQVWLKRVGLANRQRGQIEITCLVAREVNAPKGVNAIEWRLITNRNAESFEAAAELIDWYRARWEIQIDQPCCLHKSVLRKLLYRFCDGFYPGTINSPQFT
jgi:hypothetical protein